MKISGKLLKKALKIADITQAEAASRLSTTRQSLSRWLSYEELPDDIVQSVMSKLNIDFAEVARDFYPAPSTENQLTPILATKQTGVPYYDVDFIGGFNLIFDQQTARPSAFIDFAPFNDCDFWVNVSGKSMDPLISDNDIVALKVLPDWQDFLLEGEIYAIVTKNDIRTIKTIGRGEDKDHYTLIPYNKAPEYNPQPIPKRMLTHVFRVKGSIKKFF